MGLYTSYYKSLFVLCIPLKRGYCAACCNWPLQRDWVKVQQGFSTHVGPKSLPIISIAQPPLHGETREILSEAL